MGEDMYLFSLPVTHVAGPTGKPARTGAWDIQLLRDNSPGWRGIGRDLWPNRPSIVPGSDDGLEMGATYLQKRPSPRLSKEIAWDSEGPLEVCSRKRSWRDFQSQSLSHLPIPLPLLALHLPALFLPNPH